MNQENTNHKSTRGMTKNTPKYQLLPVPMEVINTGGAIELLRAWVTANGELFVCLNPTCDDSAEWGRLFAAMSYNVAESITETSGRDRNATLREIESSFYNEYSKKLNNPNA